MDYDPKDPACQIKFMIKWPPTLARERRKQELKVLKEKLAEIKKEKKKRKRLDRGNEWFKE